MFTIRRCFIVSLTAAGLHAPLFADTVYLKNGSQIDGKVSEERSNQESVVLLIDGAGALILPRSNIVSVEKNGRQGIAAPAPAEGQPAKATLRDMVAVRLKKGKSYYGEGVVYGVPTAQSTDRTLVLSVPGLGEMKLPREGVEKVEPLKDDLFARPAPAAAGPERIETRQLVTLKNGRKIRGTVVPGPQSEPLVVDVGSMGRLHIPRDRIASVEDAAGQIEIPAEAKEAPPAPPAPPEAESKEQPAPLPRGTVSVDPQLRAEIHENIYDLSRWRSRNRVRAENNLKAIGAPAIPFLEGVARDPFELTRRAVMRIVREVGDPAGIPIAIEGLLDPDDYVRATAGEALRRMTRRSFGYNPYGPEPERLDGYRRWRDWWENEGRAEYLR
jgi:hypothetical protein